jgi:hypothetical protein
MGESKGFVQIPIDEYNRFMENERTLKSLLQSNKCIEVSSLFSYDTGGAIYLCNPTTEVKGVIDRLKEENSICAKRYFDWASKDKSKKVKLWHIGKTIQQVIDDK